MREIYRGLFVPCKVESLAKCFGRQSENKVKVVVVVAAELGIGGASASVACRPRLLRL